MAKDFEQFYEITVRGEQGEHSFTTPDIDGAFGIHDVAYWLTEQGDPLYPCIAFATHDQHNQDNDELS